MGGRRAFWGDDTPFAKGRGSLFFPILFFTVTLMLCCGFAFGFRVLPLADYAFLNLSRQHSLLMTNLPFAQLIQTDDNIFRLFYQRIASPEYLLGASGSGFAQLGNFQAALEKFEDNLPLETEIILAAETPAEIVEEIHLTDLNLSQILLPEPEPLPEEESAPVSTGLPLVGIYCTHNAENFPSAQGGDKIEGTNAGIFKVAEKLQETFLAQGIGAVLSSTIHDYPEYSAAYLKSQATMEKMLSSYPSIEILIDVHRDVKPEGGTTVLEKDGRRLARVMLIVGSDQRQTHPAWQENLTYAQRVGAALDAACPGILRGVRVQKGRYNQHISSQAILIEMGSTENSLEEALASAEIFGNVLSRMLEIENRK
ncbi:MAG: stage II sporulation protein P [Clostridiales bacterium]|jgi:stage II sporulation protein P|nr:stage II sporulation protein P [Clostridiales bacterium]